jgi:hypothetical protein
MCLGIHRICSHWYAAAYTSLTLVLSYSICDMMCDMTVMIYFRNIDRTLAAEKKLERKRLKYAIKDDKALDHDVLDGIDIGAHHVSLFHYTMQVNLWLSLYLLRLAV